MRNLHPIEAQTQGIGLETVQKMEALFEDTAVHFRQYGFSQDQINAFFTLIEDMAHRQIHWEEMTRH